MVEIQRGAPIEETTLVYLIRQAQTYSDPHAFDGLYQLYADRVFRFLLSRLSDVDNAEEITSEVFLRLVEKIDRYKIAPKDNVAIFSAWLYRLAHNRMVDILRKKQRVTHVDIEHASHVSTQDNFIDRLSIKLEVEQIMQTMNMLSDQQQQVLLLRFIEGLSIAETAQVMDKSEGAVKALQHRSLGSLRRLLGLND